MTTEKCGCAIHHGQMTGIDWIAWCDLHLAAPALKAALEAILRQSPGCGGCRDIAQTALLQAGGEGGG